MANPDTRDRVTVTLTNPLEIPPLKDFGLGPGHRLENYADGAALISTSRDSTLRDSTAALAAVVGTGGTATVSRFSLRRDARPAVREVPAAPAPAPSPRPGKAGNQRPGPGRSPARTGAPGY